MLLARSTTQTLTHISSTLLRASALLSRLTREARLHHHHHRYLEPPSPKRYGGSFISFLKRGKSGDL
uniref:Uncharacterized protein MANES_11G131400 n=1 Tax=Rhizophora mucronata TaxID=61149 RepID=A0A2P2P1W2_RHIMU